MSRFHTNKIKGDRIPTRIENPIQDPTITRRHRHHGLNHHVHDPTKRVESRYSNEQATEIEDNITNATPSNETTRNCRKPHR